MIYKENREINLLVVLSRETKTNKHKGIYMKVILLLSLTLLFTANSFAASTLFCTAEDGTKVTAVESADEPGKLFDIKISIRGENEQS